MQLIECAEAKCKRWLLTDEGNQIADHGSHEANVFNNIPTDGILLDELLVCSEALFFALPFSDSIFVKDSCISGALIVCFAAYFLY